jgi:hypothetical protein
MTKDGYVVGVHAMALFPLTAFLSSHLRSLLGFLLSCFALLFGLACKETAILTIDL